MFLIIPVVIALLNYDYQPKQVNDKLTISPPIIMQKELVLRQEVVLPPPTPVAF